MTEMRQMNNVDSRFDMNIQHRDTRVIRMQSRSLSDERLSFFGGRRLGDVEIAMEGGVTLRKVRRIIEKRVNQNYWDHRSHCPSGTRRGAHETRHRMSNHMKNIYGFVPGGFRYCA